MDNPLEVKEAIAKAKAFIEDVYSDEPVAHVGLEETEFDVERGDWRITLSFSRPWNTPKTRAQEVLENLGAVSGLKRSEKIVVVRADGSVVSMKDRRLEAAE